MATRLISSVKISEVDPYMVYAEAIKNAWYHVELVDGIVREKPTPRRLHGIVQRRIRALLAELYPAELILQSLDVLTGGTNFVAPAAVAFTEDAELRHDMMASPALLASKSCRPARRSRICLISANGCTQPPRNSVGLFGRKNGASGGPVSESTRFAMNGHRITVSVPDNQDK